MATLKSQNGWAVLDASSTLLFPWKVPVESGNNLTILLRRGPAGFLLCHYAMWHSDKIEPISGEGDDFGYAHRQIAGSTQWSNHASGTAADLNASAHPSGTHTFSDSQVSQIHTRLAIYEDCIRWGGDYISSVDQMHFELNKPAKIVRAAAQEMLTTGRGQELIAANPGQEVHIV